MVKVAWVYGDIEHETAVKVLLKGYGAEYASYTPSYSMGFELKIRIAEDAEIILLASDLESLSCWLPFKRQTGFPPARPPDGTYKVGNKTFINDSAAQLTATSEVYQWAILVALDNDSLIGDSTTQEIPLNEDQSTGVINIDLSDVYAKNASAGNNIKIVWYGVVND